MASCTASPGRITLGSPVYPASVVEWRREKSRPLLLLSAYVTAFLLVVWLHSPCARGTPRFRTGYLSYGYVDPVVRGQGLLPRLFVYHNWPLFPLLMAAIQSVTSISPLEDDGLLAHADLGAVYGAAVRAAAHGDRPVVAGSTTLADISESDASVDARWVAGLWVFVIFQWTNQDYFSPQALAFLFYLGLVVVLGTRPCVGMAYSTGRSRRRHRHPVHAHRRYSRPERGRRAVRDHRADLDATVEATDPTPALPARVRRMQARMRRPRSTSSTATACSRRCSRRATSCSRTSLDESVGVAPT